MATDIELDDLSKREDVASGENAGTGEGDIEKRVRRDSSVAVWAYVSAALYVL